MIIDCVTACHGGDGPSLFFCKVRCNKDQYNNGLHYEVAADAAEQAGYDGPFVVFDENDGPAWLFEKFAHQTGPVMRVT